MHYLHHLRKDKQLARIMQNRTFTLEKCADITLKLMESVVSQQLSTKVACVIFQRFLQIYEPNLPSVEHVLETPEDVLRNVGISRSKISYIKNIASFWQKHKLTNQYLHTLSNAEIIQLLTQIKGIGNWTVEMLLMFGMQRENVFSADDLGIQKAMIQLYGIQYVNQKDLKQQMQVIAANWQPFSTYACLYLWNWKDRDE